MIEESTELRHLGLSVRAIHCLQANGMFTVGDVRQKTKTELLRMPNFGRISFEEVVEKTGWNNRDTFLTAEQEMLSALKTIEAGLRRLKTAFERKMRDD